MQSAAQQNNVAPQGPAASLIGFQQQQSALEVALQQTNALLQVSYRQKRAGLNGLAATEYFAEGAATDHQLAEGLARAKRPTDPVGAANAGAAAEPFVATVDVPASPPVEECDSLVGPMKKVGRRLQSLAGPILPPAKIGISPQAMPTNAPTTCASGTGIIPPALLSTNNVDPEANS